MAPKTIFNISVTCGIPLAKLMIFMLTVIAIMPIEIHGFSIKLIPMTSLFPKNLTLSERHHKLIEISRIRYDHHIQRQQQHSMIMTGTTTSTLTSANSTSKSANAVTPPLTVRYHPSNGFYITQLSIGSKLFSPYLIIDSGTDLSWVQCEGCTNCFPLTSTGNFKYRESESYSKLPCNHSLCVSKMCTNDGLYCLYNHFYLTSRSGGLVSTETFTFRTDSKFRATAKYSNVVFGCALDNRNIPFADGPNNVIAGVLGLDLERQSMLVQLQAQTKLRFSYCLSKLERPTFLQFGEDASTSMRRRQSGLQATPLEVSFGQYYIRMLGISIENQRLRINPEVFRLKRNHTGGFLIDSGCPYSFIVDSAYSVLKGELVEYIARRYSGLRPLQRGIKDFELCYNLTTSGTRSYVFPSMTFHLQQADFVMRPEVAFQSFGTVRCLAMLVSEGDESTILGAFQQTNYRFLFDGVESQMSFVPDNCA